MMMHSLSITLVNVKHPGFRRARQMMAPHMRRPANGCATVGSAVHSEIGVDEQSLPE
jgi:hypothetical protein